jgi:hypothetical protein
MNNSFLKSHSTYRFEKPASADLAGFENLSANSKLFSV